MIPFVAVAVIASLGAQEVEVPPVAPPSLKTVTSHIQDYLPNNLGVAIADQAAAVRLGKALFWDMQVGSDGVQACASCHFHAGADPRIKNQLNPGPGNLFDALASGGGGANYTPNACDFPFRKLAAPDDNTSPVLHDANDRLSSQGVFSTTFTSGSGGAVDNGTITPDDAGFSINGVNVRRVEPRNTPTVINSVLLHRIFWDGRANNVFNGNNPFGDTDPNAKVLVRQGGVPGDPASLVRLLFADAATASQSVGPPLSPFEMSFLARSFEELGRKMNVLHPLAGQLVSSTDSVLGALSASPNPGLHPALTYGDLIRSAFRPEFWDAGGLYDGYTQMERNFALYFGLSILAYEATLVSDDSRYDQFQDGGGEGGTTSDILTAQEKEGLDIFLNRGACIACHVGSEFAGASLNTVRAEGLLERMLMEDSIAAGGIAFATDPPPAADPNELEPPDPMPDVPLNFEPRGRTIEILPPTGNGPRIAFGVANFGVAPGACGPAVDARVALTPGAGAPANSAFAAGMRFRLDGNCGARFIVDMEWTLPGLPAGNYRLFVGGRFRGLISTPQAQPAAVYDTGFYNIGIRPTAEDIGNGAIGQFAPFALAARARAGENVDGGQLQPPVGPNERIAVNGAFKAPSLRNIELTGPYMHNGGFATLEEVVDFYSGGAHFFVANLADLDPEVAGIGGMSTERKAALVAFLKTLTDERVRFQRAPFDHPQLVVPNGHPGDPSGVTSDPMHCNGPTCQATESLLDVPAVGAGGSAQPLAAFEDQFAGCVQLLAVAGQIVAETPPAGIPGTFGARLTRRPSSNVVVNLQLSVPNTQAVLSPPSLTFTPDNWFAVQNVAIVGLQDGIADGNVPVVASIQNVVSTDTHFSGPQSEHAQFTVSDSGHVWSLINLEAEGGSRTLPMVVGNDPNASGGQFIWVPGGTGDNTSTTGNNGVATLSFNVSTPGVYRIWGLVRTPSQNDNNFWIKVDSGAYTNWNAAVSNVWTWDLVNSTSGSDPLTYNFSAGQHTLRVRWREDGARLDRLILTNSTLFVPNTGQPVAP